MLPKGALPILPIFSNHRINARQPYQGSAGVVLYGDRDMEIVKSVGIDNLINQRAALQDKLAQAVSLLRECNILANAAQLTFPEIRLERGRWLSEQTRLSGNYAAEPEQVSRDILRVIDCSAWEYLMRESGLRTFMDATARQKWDAQLESGEVAALNKENIEATFSALYQARGEMFERGVISCFKGLSWDYKTNQPFKFGKRIIVTYLMRSGSPDSSATNRLEDLVRVFHVLDHKPEPDHRIGIGSRLWQAYHARETSLDTPYLHLKWFKKGSGHVTFKRLDLVEQMNNILAKHFPHALACEK